MCDTTIDQCDVDDNANLRWFRDDIIGPQIFGFLHRAIDRTLPHFKDVIEFTNKYVAHAADATSMARLSDSQHGISIDKVQTCPKALWQVAQYIISTVLYDTYHAPGITYQGDPLKGLNQPWVDDDHLTEFYDS